MKIACQSEKIKIMAWITQNKELYIELSNELSTKTVPPIHLTCKIGYESFARVLTMTNLGTE